MENDENQREIITLDNFIVNKEPLGKGAEGTVHLSFKKGDNEIMACKKVSLEKFKSERSQKKLKSELELLYKLDSDYIIKLKGVKKTKTNIYIFTEYCDAETIDDFMDNYRQLYKTGPSPKLLQYFSKQIIMGVAYMLKNGVCHRDLKLENMMLTRIKNNIEKTEKKNDELEYKESLKKIFTQTKQLNELFKKIELSKSIQSNENMPNLIKVDIDYYNEKYTNNRDIFEDNIINNYRLKIIDLGFAKDLDNDNTKSFLGTPYFMAPEVWNVSENRNDNYDTKCDLWSLGVCLYYMAFANVPFLGSSHKNIRNNVRKGHYYIYKSGCNKISREFIDVINGLLKINPDKRYDWETLIKHPYINIPYENLIELDFEGQECIILDANNEDIKFINIDDYKNIEMTAQKKNFLEEELLNKKRSDIEHIDLGNLFSSSSCETFEVISKLTVSVETIHDDWLLVNLDK